MESESTTFSNVSFATRSNDSFRDEEESNGHVAASVIITEDMMWYLTIFYYVCLCGSMAILGASSNLVNVVVFYRLGLRDSMSVCLFVLSLTDFTLCCVITIDRAFYTWYLFYTGEGIDPIAVSHVSLAFLADSLYLCSGWILTFLSVERCVCVVRPFKVRQIFTRSRSTSVMLIIFVVVISTTAVPDWTTQWLAWVDVDVNATGTNRRLIAQFSDNRHLIEKMDAVLGTFLIPVPSLIITFGSVLFMIYGLISSSKIRLALTSGTTQAADDEKRGKLSTKTRKLVQVVLVLSVVFLICSIPRMIGKSAKVLFPEINEGAKNRFVGHLIWQSARFTATFNAFINIIVYVKINSTYREQLQELFHIFKK